MSEQTEQQAAASVPSASVGSATKRKRDGDGRKDDPNEPRSKRPSQSKKLSTFDTYCLKCKDVHRGLMKILGTTNADANAINALWGPVAVAKDRRNHVIRNLRKQGTTVDTDNNVPDSGIPNFGVVNKMFNESLSKAKTQVTTYALKNSDSDITQRLVNDYHTKRQSILDNLGISAEEALAYGDNAASPEVTEKVMNAGADAAQSGTGEGASTLSVPDQEAASEQAGN
jgi:hypothetical protein